MSDSLTTSISLGTPRAVDVAAIERELVALWKTAGDTGGKGTPAAVRACALNLLVVTPAGATAESTAELVGEVTEEHPARIFLVAESGPHGGLEAWVSARCRLPAPGASLVCCEQVTIAAGGHHRAAVPSVITSLLVPDIPVVLLWKSAVGEEDLLFPALSALADRVIVDSSDAEDPAATLLGLAGRAAEKGRRFAPGDLSWTHLAPWRTAVAEVFQEPDALSSLAGLSSVIVRVSTSRDPFHSGEGQAILFAAWLAEHLGWEPTRGNTATHAASRSLVFRAAGTERTVTVEECAAAPAGPGGIEEILLSMPGLDVTLTADGKCLRMHIARPGLAPRESVRGFLRPAEPVLLARELEVLHADPAFEAALATAARVLKT